MRDHPVPVARLKKAYQKPKLKRLDPQTAIQRLQVHASAGDKTARKLLEAIVGKE